MILASVFINILAIASPVFTMNVYDRVVPNNALETLWVLAVGVAVAFFFDFALRNLRGYFVDVAGRNADILVASKLMSHVLSMRMDHKPGSTGALVNNIREFDSLREFFSSTTLLAMVDLPFLVLFILAIAVIGGPVAAIPAVGAPIVILVGLLVQGPLKHFIETGYRESTQKNALLVEAVAMEYAKSVKNVNVIVSENRDIAIKEALNLGAKYVLLDDGFGKFHIKKFNVLIRPSAKPYFDFVLPSGAYGIYSISGFPCLYG